ncbi:MAG: rRNA maturation RNase YbeY [Pseudomonadota bacterium]|nr:rRNA maturation RNase YbeY [Pseudomonadota bacterium]
MEKKSQKKKMPAVGLEVIVEHNGWSDDLSGLDAVVNRAVRAAIAVADLPEEVRGAKELEVTVILSDDETVQDLNRTWRGKDKPTNVLSFPFLEPGGEGETASGNTCFPLILGDVILAFQTVAAEAVQQDKPLDHYVSWLVVHGILHLLGYDHETDAEATRMERLETRILRDLGIPDPRASGKNGPAHS